MAPEGQDEPDDDPGQRRIDGRAAAWHARLQHDRGGWTRRRFEAWLARDPRHGDAFHRILQGYGDARPAPRAWRPGAGRPARRIRRRRLTLALAVPLLAMAAGVLAWKEADRAQAPAGQIASTSQTRSVRLSDGSVIILQPRSLLRPGFDGRIRLVTLLSGQARFQVAHDPAHPFVVRADRLQVTARGTVFDVSLRPGAVAVALLDGVVEVRQDSSSRTVRLAKGQSLLARDGRGTDAPMSMQTMDDRDDVPPPTPATAPPSSGRDQSLASLVAAVDARGGRPIRLDGAIGHRTVRGQFDLDDSRALALQLAAALDLDLREDDSGYILAPLR